jgi:hypothetical protein
MKKIRIKIHDWKWTTEVNIVELDTVHGHKYSSPSIFYYIFHIKPHLKEIHFFWLKYITNLTSENKKLSLNHKKIKAI